MRSTVDAFAFRLDWYWLVLLVHQIYIDAWRPQAERNSVQLANFVFNRHILNPSWTALNRHTSIHFGENLQQNHRYKFSKAFEIYDEKSSSFLVVHMRRTFVTINILEDIHNAFAISPLFRFVLLVLTCFHFFYYSSQWVHLNLWNSWKLHLQKKGICSSVSFNIYFFPI